MTQPGGFDEVPDFLRGMVEDALQQSGIPEDYLRTMVDNPSTCEFGENGEFQDMFWGTFSNVLRTLFLGGAFQRAILHSGSVVASGDLEGFLDAEPLTNTAWSAYTHIQQHVCRLVFDTVARDAIEPWVLAMYDQGKYQPNTDGIDFVCITAAEEQKRREAAEAEKPQASDEG